MKNEDLDAFGTLLITQVRDETIDTLRRVIDGSMKGSDAIKVRQAIAEGLTSELLSAELIPYIVDETIASVLSAFEATEGKIYFSRGSGEFPTDLNSVSDGLQGEFFGDGWIKQYSKFPHSWLGRK